MLDHGRAYAVHRDPRDDAHLRSLEVAFRVFAGIGAVVTVLLLPLVLLGLAALGLPSTADDFMGAVFGGVFGILGLPVLIVCAVTTVLQYLAAALLRGRRRRGVCLLIAVWTAVVHVPIGTVLAALTFAVLLRPSVRFQFES